MERDLEEAEVAGVGNPCPQRAGPCPSSVGKLGLSLEAEVFVLAVSEPHGPGSESGSMASESVNT